MMGYLLQCIGYVILFVLLDHERTKGAHKSLQGRVWAAIYCTFWVAAALALVLMGLEIQGMAE